jgi:adenosylhomocysteine nucleosidase
MSKSGTVVLISAGEEWQAVRALFPQVEPQSSPLGEWFMTDLDLGQRRERVIFFHGGWGKIAAAASTQYVIDRWSPAILVNLGTCGGLEGEIERGSIVLAERTLVYDIADQMTDPQAAIAHYATELDLSWLRAPYPQPVRRTLLVSADRDLIVEDISQLKAQYNAAAGDWESGAIAWVVAHNNTRCLILRGVTDLVGASGGEAYDGNKHVYDENARVVMEQLVRALPAWLAKAL